MPHSRGRRAVAAILLVVAAGALYRSSIGDLGSITGLSMYPTLHPGDRILIDRLAYDLRPPGIDRSLFRRTGPAHDDLVVFRPAGGGGLWVKRIVGLPGETIQWEDGHLSLLTAPHRTQPSPLKSPALVPADHYLVLGDNPQRSIDSRTIGFIHRDQVVGRATSVLFSLVPGRFVSLRPERTFQSLTRPGLAYPSQPVEEQPKDGRGRQQGKHEQDAGRDVTP